MPRLTISLLGPLQVTLDDKPITGFATDKARALLAYLAVEAARPHRRDALAGLLWPDQPQRKARQNLRQALSYLRQAIVEMDDVPFLLVSRETIQFNPSGDYWLDTAAFAALAGECREHRHRRLESCLPCMRRMEQMVELYRGDFLEQFFLSDSDLFEEWAVLKREWLRREAVMALSHLTDRYERRGEYERARQYAQRQVALDPWREEAHRQLMRLLALDGQRSAALAQYEICRRALAEELGLEPTDETTALYEQIQTTDPETRFLRKNPVSLPPSPTPFVGREEELANLAELLANPDCRMVTILGPGGIGKTRLALEAAEQQSGAFAHGVHFVPLAAVNSTESIAPAIAESLQISLPSDQPPQEQLFNYLREKEMLLVTDNLEHLPAGNTLWAEMLHQSPNLVLLTTSRERLNLREEWVYEIEGLQYPHDDAVENGEPCSAVAMFQQQAHRADRHFAPDEAELAHIARICRLVEGMPLGIELSATWVTTHSCEQIATELEHSLDILTSRMHNVPERQRSIRATFEHSWQLLSKAERDILARLSIFRGGFRAEAATQVADASPATLAALLDKSLIRRVSPERYDMHPLLRQYAAEKLQDDPQKYRETEMEHIRYFATFLAQREEHLKGAKQKQTLAEIAPEIENARQAWQTAVARGDTHEVEQALESLYRFYDVRCRFQEGIDLFAQAIDRWSGDEEQAYLLGKIMARQGVLYRRLGRYQRAADAAEKGLEIFERLEIQGEQAFCMVNLADTLRHQGRYREAEKLAQKSLALARQTRDRWSSARSLWLLGLTHYRTGDVDAAEKSLTESLSISRESGNPRLVMPALNTLADIACHRGNYDAAISMFDECLVLSHNLGDKFNAAIHLNNLGTVLQVLEKYKEAGLFFRESLEICHEIGDQIGEAIALSNLGQVVHEMGLYPEAMAYYREGLAIGRRIQDQWTIMACLNNLGETACAMEDYEAASDYLTEAMQIAAETQTMTTLAEILVNVAILFTAQGKTGRAATLLALASNHPACEQAIQDKARRVMDEMGLVPPEQLPASLGAVAAEVLAELA